jgi:hypothetical protein
MALKLYRIKKSFDFYRAGTVAQFEESEALELLEKGLIAAYEFARHKKAVFLALKTSGGVFCADTPER